MDFKGAARTLDAEFTVTKLRTVIELEGRMHEEDVERVLSASKSLAVASHRVQFDMFKADLECDQATHVSNDQSVLADCEIVSSVAVACLDCELSCLRLHACIGRFCRHPIVRGPVPSSEQSRFA